MFRFKAIACPLCASLEFKVLGRKAGGYYERKNSGEMAQIVRCRNCSLIYANPMPYPQQEDLVHLYNEDYTKLLSEFVAYKDRGSDFVDIFEGHRRLKRLETILGRRGSLLDIGCGPGNLVCVARDRGWKAMGFEINQHSARFAREVNSVDVVTGRIQEYSEVWAGRFDAVHVNQVLEHTYDPLGFLWAIRQVLCAAGVLFCGVPNEDSLMNNLAHLYFKIQRSDFTPMLAPTFPPYHVLGFSSKTVCLMLHKTRLKAVRIEPVNYTSLDLQSFRNGQPLRGLNSIVGVMARVVGHGHGLDVYAVSA